MPDTNTPTSTANPVPLIAAGGMLVGFFLPWAQLLGFGVSGYNLGQLGSYGTLAWIIPLAAALLIVLNLYVPETNLDPDDDRPRPFQVITGLIPWAALAFGVIEVGPQLFQVLSIGPYVILIAGTSLLFQALADQP